MAINFNSLPDDALLRQRQLLGGIVPFSSSTLWRRVKAGKFPKPTKLNDGRMTCWRVGDVRRWLSEQGQGGTA